MLCWHWKTEEEPTTTVSSPDCKPILFFSSVAGVSRLSTWPALQPQPKRPDVVISGEAADIRIGFRYLLKTTKINVMGGKEGAEKNRDGTERGELRNAMGEMERASSHMCTHTDCSTCHYKRGKHVRW